MAIFKSSKASTVTWQNCLIWALLISALVKTPDPENLLIWACLAFSTLFRIVFESSEVSLPVNFSTSTAGTSKWISILSIKGPEILFLYREICPGIQTQFFFGLPKNPHGQGFWAASKINWEGKVILPELREIVTFLSSKGCLKASKTCLGNSGNSSKNNTPRWAKETSPGLILLPPPIIPT